MTDEIKQVNVPRSVINPDHWYAHERLVRFGHAVDILEPVPWKNATLRAAKVLADALADLEPRLEPHGVRSAVVEVKRSRAGRPVTSRVWVDEHGERVRLVLEDRPGDCPLTFKGWWGDGDEADEQTADEPWERFRVTLYAREAGDYVTEPDRIHQIARLAGYELILRKKGEPTPGTACSKVTEAASKGTGVQLTAEEAAVVASVHGVRQMAALDAFDELSEKRATMKGGTE